MSAIVDVQERLGTEATTEDAESVIQLAKAIWQEQLDVGIGEPDECVSTDGLGDWLSNRTYDWAVTLWEAAHGNVSALAKVRAEAGLPIVI